MNNIEEVIKEITKKKEEIVIGFSIKNIDNYFINHIFHQIFFSYKILLNAGFKVVLISCDDNFKNLPHFDFSIINIKDIAVNNINIIICIGSEFHEQKDILFLKSLGIKLIKQICNDELTITQENIIFDKNSNITFFKNMNLYDQIWIFPMHLHLKEFIETINRNKVIVVPYLWCPEIINKYIEIKNIDIRFEYNNNMKDNFFFLIQDNNESTNSNCIIPLTIMEDYFYKMKNKVNFKKIFLFNSKKNKSFDNFLDNLIIHKNSRIEFYPKVSILDVLDNLKKKGIPIIPITNQKLNEFDFSSFELLYLGYPIIHNLSNNDEYGLYYSDSNIFNASQHISSLTSGEKNYKSNIYKDKLYTYSPDNKKNISKYKEILDNFLIGRF